MTDGRGTVQAARLDGVQTVGLIVCLSLGRPPGVGREAWALGAERVYLPLIDLIAEHEGARVCIAVHGGLLEWLEEHDPARLAKLVQLVVDRRIEVLIGPHAGALLPAIPERDALGQLQVALRWWRQHGDVLTRGAWLPHGVWDPGLTRVLGRLGFHYTLLDEAQMFPPARPDGYYLTEREGTGLAVFPASSMLAHAAAREAPERVVERLQVAARDGYRCLTLHLSDVALGTLSEATAKRNLRGPNPWLRRFFTLLVEQSGWLKPATFSHVLDRMRPTERAYPPAAVGHALAVAALGAGRGDTWARLYREAHLGRDPSLSEVAPFLRPPPWDMLLAGSPEIHRLHKRMLLVSANVLRLRSAARDGEGDSLVSALQDATAALYRGQDALGYVLGLECGAQDGAARHEGWSNLVRAEHIVRTAFGEAGQTTVETTDYDCDGRSEVVVRTPWLCGIVAPSQGGALVELDGWNIPGNVLNAATRRPEAGHLAFQRGEKLPALIAEESHSVEIQDEDDDPRPVRTDALIRSGLGERLHYDRFTRAAFMDHFLGPEAGLQNIVRARFPETGDFVGAEYSLLRLEEDVGLGHVVTVARDGNVTVGDALRLVRIVKRYVFVADAPRVEIRYEIINRYHEPIRTRFAVELSLNLDSRLGTGTHLEVDGLPVELGGTVDTADVHEVGLVDAASGCRMTLQSSHPAGLWLHPIETLGRTLTGIDTLFQGTAIWLHWPLELWGQEKRRIQLTLSIES